MCSSKIWLQIIYQAETFGFILSFTSHFILLILINESPKAKFGSYKYLMMSLSMMGISYSLCDFWCKPNVYLSDTSFFLFTVLEHWQTSKFVGTVSLAVYCTCYAMFGSILTFQFYYRYVSVTSPVTLATKFSGKMIILNFIVMLLASSSWGFIQYFLDGPSEFKSLEINQNVFDKYCLGPNDFAYLGPKYYYHESGVTYSHTPSLIVILSMTPMTGSNFGCLIFFGVKTYRNLQKGLINTSSGSRDLQQQLFRTLVIQACIPTVFMYFPTFCCYYLPLYGVTVPELEILIPISVAVYPCMEPLVAMYFIKSFRWRIRDVVTCSKNRIDHASSLQRINNSLPASK